MTEFFLESPGILFITKHTRVYFLNFLKYKKNLIDINI